MESISADRFDLMRREHGGYGSWAVWTPATRSPKSNMGDLSVLDEKASPELLRTLNPGVVMIGLNVSRFCDDRAFGNFHSLCHRRQGNQPVSEVSRARNG